ncbi:SDR family NAD(P)-dependent oxidoreductase [Heyndrickxia sporothermodurans]|uniref:SDR family NAD(P)-dependent oxidoreductase n=1 Tax=Heyndrickxia sporothermodurans TaxID=46224 RepID=UPI002E1F8266|nr:SDR family NAD(P)-dependent oxidoreductase [Heyndrickxia sporothermodurans]
MTNPMDLTDKHILVVGASSGIGKETAVLLSKLGAKVSLLARNEGKLIETQSLLGGTGHDIFTQDLKDIDAIENLIEQIAKKQGVFDGIVYSAGVTQRRTLSMLKYNHLHELMQVNFYAFIELMRCVTKKKNRGVPFSAVVISSTASMVGDKGKIAYSASKGAINSVVRCMAKELADKEVRVNAILPSWIKTEMFDDAADTIMEFEDTKQVLAKQYLGIGESRDVANMVGFLLSDAAKFITGTTIAVDGGRLSS